MVAAEHLDAAVEFILGDVERNVADRPVAAAGIFPGPPLDRKRRRRSCIGRERFRHAPEQLRQMRISQPLQAEHGSIRRNRKLRDVDDRAGIDLFDHDMRGCAEFGCPMVEREMRRRPSGIAGRTGMKIESAVAEPIENSRGDDDRRRECNQPGPPQHVGIQGVADRQGFWPISPQDCGLWPSKACGSTDCSASPDNRMIVSNIARIS